MKWQKWGEYAAKSDCAKYSVSRAMVSGNWIFEAWRLPGIHLGKFKTSKEASTRCVQHERDVNEAK